MERSYNQVKPLATINNYSYHKQKYLSQVGPNKESPSLLNSFQSGPSAKASNPSTHRVTQSYTFQSNSKRNY